MGLAHRITLQKLLFPVGPSILDDHGYLTIEVIKQLREIDRDLRSKNEKLSVLTDISQDSWNSWLIKRRRPSGAGLAFLKLLVTQPEIVLNTLQSRKTVYVSSE
ncbi:hypothetical protein ACVBEF_06415 [Glaciimonas sp. GG7]